MIGAELVGRAHDVDLLSTAKSLGARLKRISAVEWVGPCPKCGGRDRFSVNTKKRLWNCRGCGKGGDDGISLASSLLGLNFRAAVAFLAGEEAPRRASEAPRPSKTPPPISDTNKTAASDNDNRKLAIGLWRRRKPIVEGCPTWRYLRKARGYNGPIPTTLGFLPASGDYPPSLIAAFGLADEPEPGVLAIGDDAVRAVHLVRLAPDGNAKAGTDGDKITIGQGALGAPIVCAAPNDLLGLAITEGLEDALSIHAATGLGAWAAASAGRMPALAEAVPGFIECVTVVGHRDQAGERGARELSARLIERGFETILKFLEPAA